MEKKRLATYKVKVPLQFTFAGDNDLDRDELIKACINELNKRLDNGYFDVLEDKLEVVDKTTHYTKEEIRERNRQWQEFLMGVK